MQRRNLSCLLKGFFPFASFCIVRVDGLVCHCRIVLSTKQSVPRLNSRLFPLLNIPKSFLKSLDLNFTNVLMAKDRIKTIVKKNFELVKPIYEVCH
jgi:hypothetical protein